MTLHTTDGLPIGGEPLAGEREARVRSAKTLASGSRFLSGTLAGGGHFSMLRSASGILRGEFHSMRGVFTMRSQGLQRALVEQRDVSKLPGYGHDAAQGEATFPCSARAQATAITDLVELVDWEGRTSQQPTDALPASIALERGSAHAFCEGAPPKHLHRLGDFNGDGRADVLLRHADGRWLYHPMDGNAVLAGGGENGRLTRNPVVTVRGVGDFNGDGKADVLLRHADGRWLYHGMDGRAVLGGGGSGDLPADATVWVAGVGDMDGDGRAEVLTRHGHDAWGYYAMNENGVFTYGGDVGLASESAWGMLAGGVAAPPRASAAFGDQPLAIGADATLDLSEHFTGDRTLAFEVESSDSNVVRASVAAGVLTLAGVADGRATVTVTARDANGYVVEQTFLAIVSASGQVGRRFRDCPQCPEMVVVPPGSFVMGSPAEEEGEPQSDQRHERPQHRVDFAAPSPSASSRSRSSNGTPAWRTAAAAATGRRCSLPSTSRTTPLKA